MYAEAVMYTHAAAVGLAAGGIVVSFHRLVTERHASFQWRPASGVGTLWQVLVIAFGGPLVLMRNAIRGRVIERRPLPFVAASAIIASLWCFFSGVFLLNLIALSA